MIWIAAILVPFAVGLSTLSRRGHAASRWLAPAVPFPAVALALSHPQGSSKEFDWLFLGARLELTAESAVFLFFTAVLWALAGAFAAASTRGDPKARQFFLLFYLSMTGNFGLLLSQDLPGFYTFFALMTFSAFGLVVHTGSPEAHRAGRIYLVLAVIGEAMLLGGFFLGAYGAQSLEIRSVATWLAEDSGFVKPLLIAGFGVKAGLLGLHFWLPLAHPAAPIPASAVLSGAMIKAGLFGWIQFLPAGASGEERYAVLLVVMGFAGAFFGVVAGTFQNDPKVNLAYSSISQMGIMTAAVGMGLFGPEAWLAVAPVLAVYALNHAFAKGALFLGVGVATQTGRQSNRRILVLACLALPALAIAGAPWTGGAMVKYGLKNVSGHAPELWAQWIDWLLPLSSVGTALLLGRFLWLVWNKMLYQTDDRPALGLWAPWFALVLASASGAFLAARYSAIELPALAWSLSSIWSNAWPVLLGVGFLLMCGSWLHHAKPRIPPGDIVVLAERGAAPIHSWIVRDEKPASRFWSFNLVDAIGRIAESEVRRDVTTRMEAWLTRWEVPGLLFTLLLLLFLFFLNAG